MSAAPQGWVQALLHFWFEELAPEQRFARDDSVDRQIRTRFAMCWHAMRGQQPSRFLKDRETALAAVLLFDQVPRNMFRNDARAFATDRLARAIARRAISKGWLCGLAQAEQQFLLMPLMHSERIADQRQSLVRFTRLGSSYIRSFAVDHYRMVARFGRFPHRNAVLGRKSSPAEKAAVAAGNHW